METIIKKIEVRGIYRCRNCEAKYFAPEFDIEGDTDPIYYLPKQESHRCNKNEYGLADLSGAIEIKH